MDKYLKEILNRKIEDWGELKLSEFSHDIAYLKAIIIKQDNRIRELQEVVEHRMELTNPNLLKQFNILLDGEPITQKELDGAIGFVSQLRKIA